MAIPLAREVAHEVSHAVGHEDARAIPQDVSRDLSRGIPGQADAPAVPDPSNGRRLRLAFQRQSRLPVFLLAAATLVVLAGLLSLAVFHTQLASRQLEINQLEQQARDERERFDQLRYRRAELRSPGRLSEGADRLGMVPGSTSDFVEIDQWRLAQQLAAAGGLDDSARLIVIDTDPLEQFSDVKRVSAGQP